MLFPSLLFRYAKSNWEPKFHHPSLEMVGIKNVYIATEVEEEMMGAEDTMSALVCTGQGIYSCLLLSSSLEFAILFIYSLR